MFRKIYLNTFFLFILCLHTLEAEIDLEERLSECVIETKQICIPEYPTAFNPSIIRFEDKLLLSFRIIPDRKHTFTSKLGLQFLDDDFNLIGKPELLEMQEPDAKIPPRTDDGRLITVGSKLYMVYSDNKDEKISKGGFRVYIARLQFDGERFTASEFECLSHFEGESKALREKNWVPFEFNNELLLAYSLEPHLIFKPLLNNSGFCETVACSYGNFEWDFGALRGGTQALKIDESFYLSFFHSCKQMATIHSDGISILHYFMGAYTFEAEPPFAITKISLEPIIGDGFYKGETYKPYWHPVRAIFPCGFIYDETFIWVVYGRQDHELWVVKLDKARLFNSLVQVKRNP